MTTQVPEFGEGEIRVAQDAARTLPLLRDRPAGATAEFTTVHAANRSEFAATVGWQLRDDHGAELPVSFATDQRAGFSVPSPALLGGSRKPFEIFGLNQSGRFSATTPALRPTCARGIFLRTRR